MVRAIMLSVLLSGCATYGGYQPTVDPYSDPNPQTLNRDMSDCQQLAKDAASTGKETAKGAVVGGALGAAGGAAIGAITGNAGKGAAIGAAAGGISGGAYSGYDADNQYKRAYINCMRNRGHNVSN